MCCSRKPRLCSLAFNRNNDTIILIDFAATYAAKMIYSNARKKLAFSLGNKC